MNVSVNLINDDKLFHSTADDRVCMCVILSVGSDGSRVKVSDCLTGSNLSVRLCREYFILLPVMEEMTLCVSVTNV